MSAQDVVVVGGGPAGLAGAIALSQRGLRVLVVERGLPPIDKPCGEGVMPDGLAALSRLGVVCNEALPLRGIRFTEGGYSAEGLFPDHCGLGIRRTVLHKSLIERALEAGVTIRWGESVRPSDDFAIEVHREKLACRWIVGADGRQSLVRQWAGFSPPAKMPVRVGFRQHFRTVPWSDLVEVHWHDRGQAVVTPVAPDEICVSLLANNLCSRVPDLFDLYPDLMRCLAGAEISSAARGTICSGSIMRSVVRGRVALIGDAAGAMDAITGEGLALSFRQAFALADAMAADKLEEYEKAHRRLRRPSALMSWLMLTIGGRKRLRRRVLEALATHPRVLSFAVAAHTGLIPITALPVGAMAGFVGRLLIGSTSKTKSGVSEAALDAVPAAIASMRE